METDKNILPPPDNAFLKENVFAMKNTFSDHGNEIEEIISNKPPFIVRWGTVYFFFVLLLIGLISWFIQYPDIVIARAKLTSLNPPKAIVAKSDGQLVKLFAKEGEMVHKDEVIGYMESTANPETVIYLSTILDSLQSDLNNGHIEKINNLFSVSLVTSQNNLGELQQQYQLFNQSLVLFRSYLSNGFYLRKKTMLMKDMVTLQRLNTNLYQQKNMQEEDLTLAQQTFSANEKLKNDSVISAFDYKIGRAHV